MSLCCALENFERAKEYFQAYTKNKYVWSQTPRKEDLITMVQASIKYKDIQSAVDACMVLAEIGFEEGGELARKVLKKLNPTEKQAEFLKNFSYFAIMI